MFRLVIVVFMFFFKQKTAYEMRISDWSSDVCSSDLRAMRHVRRFEAVFAKDAAMLLRRKDVDRAGEIIAPARRPGEQRRGDEGCGKADDGRHGAGVLAQHAAEAGGGDEERSEEHTSELQSLMRISYAVFCLKK